MHTGIYDNLFRFSLDYTLASQNEMEKKNAINDNIIQLPFYIRLTIIKRNINACKKIVHFTIIMQTKSQGNVKIFDIYLCLCIFTYYEIIYNNEAEIFNICSLKPLHQHQAR